MPITPTSSRLNLEFALRSESAKSTTAIGNQLFERFSRLLDTISSKVKSIQSQNETAKSEGDLEGLRIAKVRSPLKPKPEGLTGDFDSNGKVDYNDYKVWEESYGKQGSGLSADANKDGVISGADFTIWNDTFRDMRKHGDYDGDGKVDSADYQVWSDSFGQSGKFLLADGNGDGIVSGADFTVWSDNMPKA